MRRRRSAGAVSATWTRSTRRLPDSADDHGVGSCRAECNHALGGGVGTSLRHRDDVRDLRACWPHAPSPDTADRDGRRGRRRSTAPRAARDRFRGGSGPCVRRGWQPHCGLHCCPPDSWPGEGSSAAASAKPGSAAAGGGHSAPCLDICWKRNIPGQAWPPLAPSDRRWPDRRAVAGGGAGLRLLHSDICRLVSSTGTFQDVDRGSELRGDGRA